MTHISGRSAADDQALNGNILWFVTDMVTVWVWNGVYMRVS